MSDLQPLHKLEVQRKDDSLYPIYKRLDKRLREQSIKVIDARCLRNSSISLFNGVEDSLTGLTLELNGTYTLDLDRGDHIWLSKDANKSTTVFTVGCPPDQITAQLESIKRKIHKDGWSVEGDELKGGGDQSVGLLSLDTHNHEDGSNVREYFVIIKHVPSDPSLKERTGSVSEYYEKCKTIMDNYDSLAKVTNMVKEVFPRAEPVFHKVTNKFFKGTDTFVYVNDAFVLQPSDAHCWVQLGAGVGYYRYDYTNEGDQLPKVVRATLGYQKDAYDWADMSDRRQAFIRNTTAWTNNLSPICKPIQAKSYAIDAQLTAELGGLGLHNPQHVANFVVCCGSTSDECEPAAMLKYDRKGEHLFHISALMPFISANHRAITNSEYELFNPKYFSKDGTMFKLPPDMLQVLCSKEQRTCN